MDIKFGPTEDFAANYVVFTFGVLINPSISRAEEINQELVASF
jgi:hypothetical protein